MLYIKIRYYTDLRLGVKKLANIFQPFDLEFQPYIKEIDAKEGVIRELAGAATMRRIGSMYSYMVFGYNRAKSNKCIQTWIAPFRTWH